MSREEAHTEVWEARVPDFWEVLRKAVCEGLIANAWAVLREDVLEVPWEDLGSWLEEKRKNLADDRGVAWVPPRIATSEVEQCAWRVATLYETQSPLVSMH